MRLFLDTNVLLDVYLRRAGEPGSSRVIAACGEPRNQGLVAVHTLSNAFYLISRQRTRVEAWEFLGDVLAWADIAVLGIEQTLHTLSLEMADFEDALQIAAAEAASADVIITRNIRDFVGRTNLRVLLPEEYLNSEEAT